MPEATSLMVLRAKNGSTFFQKSLFKYTCLIYYKQTFKIESNLVYFVNSRFQLHSFNEVSTKL